MISDLLGQITTRLFLYKKGKSMRVKWTRDEVILGLDVLFSTSISYLTENSLPIIELSNALRSMPIINESIKNDLFRSPSEVQNPRQIAQQFRSKSHSDSGANRTVIPEQIAHF